MPVNGGSTLPGVLGMTRITIVRFSPPFAASSSSVIGARNGVTGNGSGGRLIGYGSSRTMTVATMSPASTPAGLRPISTGNVRNWYVPGVPALTSTLVRLATASTTPSG